MRIRVCKDDSVRLGVPKHCVMAAWTSQPLGVLLLPCALLPSAPPSTLRRPRFSFKSLAPVHDQAYYGSYSAISTRFLGGEDLYRAGSWRPTTIDLQGATFAAEDAKEGHDEISVLRCVPACSIACHVRPQSGRGARWTEQRHVRRAVSCRCKLDVTSSIATHPDPLSSTPLGSDRMLSRSRRQARLRRHGLPQRLPPRQPILLMC